MIAPEKRIALVNSVLHQSVVAWTGSTFETVVIVNAPSDGSVAEEVTKVLDVLNRVLECQKQDLLDAPAEGG